MAPTCIICGSVRVGISLHKFPTTNQAVRNEWLDFVSRHGIDRNKVFAFSKLCSRHFDRDDFTFTAVRRVLRREAVPNDAVLPDAPVAAVDMVPHAVVEGNLILQDNVGGEDQQAFVDVEGDDDINIDVDGALQYNALPDRGQAIVDVAVEEIEDVEVEEVTVNAVDLVDDQNDEDLMANIIVIEELN